MALAFSVIFATILCGTLLSKRLEKWYITVPILMVTSGLLVGWQTSTPIIDRLDSPTIERGIEILLATLLFLDATEVRGTMHQYIGPMLRIVLMAYP